MVRRESAKLLCAGSIPAVASKFMYYVYALQSLKDTKWLYIGYSDDLKARIETHNAGKVRSTQFYRPLRLVYYEAYLDKNDAAKREYELKHISKAKEELKGRLIKSLLI